MICTRCGTSNATSDALPGSGWIELVLWLCWLLPGVIYSIWRRGKRRPVCSACGSHDLVPLESPAGRRLAERYGVTAAPTPVPEERTSPRVLLVLVGLVLVLASAPMWLGR